jgi:CARDB protein
MRRALLVLVVMFLVVAFARDDAGAQDVPVKLAATLAACETSADAAGRFAVFTASMPARAGTRRMSMRFDLQERRSDTSGFATIAAPKFGRWDRSKAGVAGFVYTKRVTKLAQGRWYRAVVHFRWHDARGRVQRSARRATPVCHQPDQRPNLELVSLGAAKPGRYLVTIVNTGMTAAPGSTVAVEPRPETDYQRDVPPLAPGERTTVAVEAEPCAKDSVVVVQLDRLKVVDESREDDNRVESDCPSADRLG